MKNIFGLLLIVLLGFSCDSDESVESDSDETAINTPKVSFTSFEQKISYCIGLDHGTTGRQFYTSEQLNGKFNIPELEKGMVNYLKGEPLRIQPFQVDSVFGMYLKENGQVDSSIVSSADGSYAVGINEARVLIGSFVSKGIDQELVVDLLVKGVEDGLRGVTPSVPLKEARIEIVAYYSEINRSMGEEFMIDNLLTEGVEVTESGLQYQIFNKGIGVKPTLTDTVMIHYTGRFVDGREFESTIPSRKPVQLSLMNVMPGWTEGIQLMKEGGQYRFFIPYQLGYGEKGSGPIEPYSALVFDIELIKVKKYVPGY
jgi:FKBP-type peptidyl-prolyl cis-trans isomerase FklB